MLEFCKYYLPSFRPMGDNEKNTPLTEGIETTGHAKIPDCQPLPANIKNLLNLWADPDIQQAINHVYGHYLSQPYPEEYIKANRSLSVREIESPSGTQIINRPWHGLAHTLRGAFLIPIMATLYQAQPNESKEFINISKELSKPLVIKQLILTYLFTVVGRQNEAGWEYGTNKDYKENLSRSADAFDEYAKEHLTNVFEHPSTRAAFKRLILNYGDPKNFNPKAIIFRQCHNLDLLRCRTAEEFEEHFLPGPQDQDHTLIKDLGEEIAYALKQYSMDLLKATGSCIMGHGGEYIPHDNAKFLLASTIGQTCINNLLSAQMPTTLLSRLEESLQQTANPNKIRKAVSEPTGHSPHPSKKPRFI